MGCERLMSLPTSYTIEDYYALESAIKSGVLEVRFSDRVMTYRSQNEMLALLEIMARKLELSSAPRTHFVETRKGPRPGFYPGAGRNKTGFEQ